MQITITKCGRPLWYKGVIGRYQFEAKVYDEPSTYGINEGRISKLRVWDGTMPTNAVNPFESSIMNYDREWNIEPEGAYAAMADALIARLEQLPR